MECLKVKLDLKNDAAEIFGVSQNLDCSSSGHQSSPLYDHDVDINTCVVVNDEIVERKIIIKLHKQSAHPSLDKLKTLQDAGYQKGHSYDVLEEIYTNCDTCLKSKETSLKPITCLPLSLIVMLQLWI